MDYIPLDELQTRSNTLYPTASDYLNNLLFWCHYPAYKLRNDLPLDDEEQKNKDPMILKQELICGLLGMRANSPINVSEYPLLQPDVIPENLPLYLPRNCILKRDESYCENRRGFWGPIWEDEAGPNKLVRGRISISKMVELYHTKADCIIEDDFDIPEILYRIDNYLVAVKNRLEEKLIYEYVEKLLSYREAFYERIFLKVLNKNPVIKKAYEEEYGEPYSLDTLAVGAKRNEVDPIRKLKKPPITLPILDQEEIVIDEKSHLEESNLWSYD